MPAVLARQLEAYDEAANDASRLSGAALAGELEIVIDLGVALFEAIGTMVERDNERAAVAGGAMPERVARGYLAAYRQLEVTFARTGPLIGQLEAMGSPVGNVGRFDAAHLELRSLLSFDYDRLVEAAASEVSHRSSAKVRDALRRKLATGRGS